MRTSRLKMKVNNDKIYLEDVEASINEIQYTAS
jgi:hypothetical protein